MKQPLTFGFGRMQVRGGNVPVRTRGTRESSGEEMREILRRGSSQNQILLQQGELLSQEQNDCC